MDWLAIIFVISILACVRVSFHNWNAAYLAPANTNALRGIMAIGVVLHHLAEHCHSGRLFHYMYLDGIGYLLVAVFFFLSGYGLMVQFGKKGTPYLKSLWSKRILFFVIVFVLDMALYIVFHLLNGKACTVRTTYSWLMTGHVPALSAWYLVAQVVFYVFFWLAFSRIPVQRWAVTGLFVLVLGISGVWLLLGYPQYWSYSNLAFCTGVLWALKRDAIETFCKQHYWIALLCATGLFVLFSGIPLAVKGRQVYVACRMVSSTLFAVWIIVLLQKITFVGMLWQKVSIFSLEIFLLHGLVYRLLRSNMIRIDNETLWVVMTVVISVLISIPAHRLNMKIKDWSNKIGQ